MLAPDSRIMRLNQAPVDMHGDFVLYWMTAARRTCFNFGLEHAAALARELGKGLVVLEALRCDYTHASPRLHAFIIQGMADNHRTLREKPVLYYPYLEPKPAAGKGLLAAWAAKASLVVCDWFPCFFIPRMLAAAAKRIAVRMEAVDSCGLIPLSAPGKLFARAYDFRRWLQKNLPGFLAESPAIDPLAGYAGPRTQAPKTITRRWPRAEGGKLASNTALNGIKIPDGPQPVETRGGCQAADKAWHLFLSGSLAGYAQERNQPEPGVTSGLSSYLHFGHISAHQIFWELAEAESWAPQHLGAETKGQREGWWGMSASAEAFLDQIVTWRELGYNFCQMRADYDHYESLPDWAKATLHAHAKDKRPYRYSRDQLESADSHDEVWNAAQRQLLREGVIAGYLRMLWGKKVLEWSASPKESLENMIWLNDRYALDGRDPNSYSGVFWCLGRYDRPFGPERPVFGKVRYMSSANTRRKLRLAGYLKRFGQDSRAVFQQPASDTLCRACYGWSAPPHWSRHMESLPATGLPLITEDLPGICGEIKQEPAHFIVEELPLYDPQGRGDHLYIRIEREGMTTREVVEALSQEFSLAQTQIGYAGLKDKEARCIQTFSLADTGMEETEVQRRVTESLGLEAHWVKRHGNKLKRGHLLGNRFEVLVSEVGDEALTRAQKVAVAVNQRGLPNYFGEQRFGVAGDNAEAGRRLLKGRGKKGPRQKWLRGLMLNAFQSELFNRWLAERIRRGEFGSLLLGDIAKKTDTGGLFQVDDPLVEQLRLDRGEITYTGPIYGHKMRCAAAEAGKREAQVLEAENVSLEELKKAGLKGTRRPARLIPGTIQIRPHDAGGAKGLWFFFALPKGSYATILLREFIK